MPVKARLKQLFVLQSALRRIALWMFGFTACWLKAVPIATFFRAAAAAAAATELSRYEF